MENTLENTRTLTLTFQELYGKIMLDRFDLSLDIDEDVQQKMLDAKRIDLAIDFKELSN